MKLREYQQRTTNEVRELERTAASERRPRLCVQSPTGSGKTIMLADLLTDGEPQLVLTHRRVLLDQLAGVLSAHGIRFGMRAAGCKSDPTAPVQLAMMQTEYARVFQQKRWALHPARRVHVDEIHAQSGESTETILNAYHAAGASIVGWSATPSEISHLCDKLLVAASVPDLIQQGYLVPPVMFSPNMPDLERLEQVKRQANGEFKTSDLDRVWNVKAIFGSVIEHYLRLNPAQKPAILFAPGVPHSLWFAQRLTASGIRAAHIDGETIWLDGQECNSDSEARQAVFEGIASGDIKVVCNRFVLREGFDLPVIEHVILACAFGTRKPYVQAAGRGLRPSPGKTRCIVQDHGGNYVRFPLLASVEPWDMAKPDIKAAREWIERIRNDEETEPIYCPSCSAIRVTGDECPVCGYRFTHYTRPVIQVSGELVLEDGRTFKPRPRPRRRTDAELWRGLVIGNRKYHPQRTPEQIYNYYRRKNDWVALPRDLPLMPRTDAGWHTAIGKLSDDDLIGEPSVTATRDQVVSEKKDDMPNTETSYKQLRDGGWGLRGTKLEPGRTVDVTLKGGGTKKERVGKILFEGEDGFTIATIAPSARQAAQLKKCGYSTDEVAQMTKGKASELLDTLAENDWKRTDEPATNADSQDNEEIPF